MKPGFMTKVSIWSFTLAHVQPRPSTSSTTFSRLSSGGGPACSMMSEQHGSAAPLRRSVGSAHGRAGSTHGAVRAHI
jgi:hypothetical protein